MSWIKSTGPFYVLFVIGLISLIFSIYDVVYDKGWMLIIATCFVIIVILTLVLIFLVPKEEPNISPIEEFEKTLKGGLYHFKCPTCSGIFAIKKSKSNNDKPVKMDCPDCGAIGVIPTNPAEIEEEIPEKKSMKASFKCNFCGEGITVWAEGADLYSELNVYSCPFCGEKEQLKKF